MEVRELPVQVRGFGAEPATAVVDIAVLSGSDRLKRAGWMLGLSVAGALIALPIPLVHFVLVPTALLTGLLLAGYRLTESEVFRRAVGRCPFCATEQAFPVLGRFRLPKRAHCVACQRELSIEAKG